MKCIHCRRAAVTVDKHYEPLCAYHAEERAYDASQRESVEVERGATIFNLELRRINQ